MRHVEDLIAVTPTSHPQRARRKSRFRSDERGVVSIIAATTLVLVIAVAAIVVDAGSMLLARRTLQTATDAAALTAVQHLDAAAAAATDALTQNGYAASNLSLAQTGRYDKTRSLGSRFVPTSDPAEIDAIRISTQATAPMYFSRALGLSSFANITATATAAISPVASFQAGTRLAQLQGGIANAVLGGLLGTTLSLSAVDYEGLLDTDVSAFGFLNALATHAGVSSTSTYGDLLGTDVTIGEILEASLDVLQSPDGEAIGDPTHALGAIQTLVSQAPSGTTLKLGEIISTPSLLDRTVGSTSANSPFLNLYSIVASTARAAGAGTVVNLNTGITIPLTGSSVHVRLAVGQGMQVATGPVGTSIDTAQVRLAIDLQLASVPLAPLTTTSINLPIYISAAPGRATVKAIPCTSDTMVTLTGTSGAATLQYGSIADAALTNFSSTPTASAGSIASVTAPLLGTVAQINASGSASVASHGPEDHDFSLSDIQARTIQSVPTGDSGQLIATNGPGALQTSTTILGTVDSTLLNTLTSTVTSQLVSALALLDTPVNSLLTALGLKLGVLDMAVTGARCGVPTLVN